MQTPGQDAAPRAGPVDHMGPVQIEGRNSTAKPAAVIAVETTARATGWRVRRMGEEVR